MLSREEIAWTVYIVLFALFFILLITRSHNHIVLLLPFILFSLLSLIAHIIMLTRQYTHETSLLVVGSRSPAVSYLPMFSLLLYIGLAEYELTAIMQCARQVDHHQFKYKKPMAYWIVIGLTFIYCSVTIALFTIMVVLDDSRPSTRASEGALVIVLILLVLLLTRRWRILLTAPFGFALTGISVEMWILRTMVENPATADLNSILTVPTWLVMEAFLIYMPIMVMLALVSWKTGSLGSTVVI